MTTTFTCFPALPVQSRIKVWRDVLPDDVGSSLYFYRNKGCWWRQIWKTLNEQCSVTRPFDCATDAVYIADDKWEDVCDDPSDRIGEPDLEGQEFDVNADVVNIAVSETLFMQVKDIKWLPRVKSMWMNRGVVFVVLGAQSDIQQGPWRWDTDGAALTWDMESENCVFQQVTGIARDEKLYSKIGDAARTALRVPLTSYNIESLEVRPVTIARK